MKIKNMKLMLLGLLTIMGVSNAFAAIEVVDEAGRSVNGINYRCVTNGANKYATVVGVNNQATEAEQKTISIPATVTGDKGTYKVVGFAESWWNATGLKNVTGVTESLSIDVTNFTQALEGKGLDHAKAFDGFTNLQSLTITESNAAKDAKITSIDCSKMADDTKGKLKSYNFSGSNIKTLAPNCFKEFTALEAIDLTGIETIGANAFDGAGQTDPKKTNIKTLTVPNTVKSIGASAFANMTKLETVTINANNAITTLPENCFSGDNAIKTLTISAAELTTIPGGVFTTAVLETLDLRACPKLATISETAFAAGNHYKKVYLAGTALTTLEYPSLAASAGTLEEITFPAGITALPAAFTNFVKLKKVDLSGTGVKAIPANEFQGCKVMTEAILHAETASIGEYAFEGCVELATVTNLGNDKMATIDPFAFAKTKLTAVDLSGTAVTMIRQYAFADCAELASVTLSDKITGIAEGTFSHCVKLASLNLEDTKVSTLRRLFTSGEDDETAPCDALKSLTLPETLTTVDDCALQMTGIEEITIPSSVSSFGAKVLQGCTNLKKFTWVDAKVNSLSNNTFTGDDNLEEVTFKTLGIISVEPKGLDDSFFVGNDKDVLMVYVTGESYAALVAAGWTEANSKYATLVGEEEKEFAFNEKGKSAVDDFYYATYYNKDAATWFPADKFEVFSAVINGSNVVLKPADVENGYYKVATWDGKKLNPAGCNRKISVCVIRSKDLKAMVEYKYAGFNNISTLPTDNGLQVTDGTVVPSRLKFQYKLGVKDGQVKFWRVTSGTLKDGVVFIESTNPKAPEFMDIVLDGEATAINAIETVNEENGAIYNLQGVQVKNAQKGLYIQNGQKFIVK